MLRVVSQNRRRWEKKISESHVATIITKAYAKSLTVQDIAAGFWKCVISPFDDCRMFAEARPHIFVQPNRISSHYMVRMMDEIENRKAAEIVDDVHVHSSGFLDTTYGPVLTMEAALGLMRLSERSKAISYTKALSKAAEKQRRETIERERVVLRDAIMIALMLCVAQGCMESRSSCRGR
ncbi:unnamed protein product [Agarophyton chilense]